MDKDRLASQVRSLEKASYRAPPKRTRNKSTKLPGDCKGCGKKLFKMVCPKCGWGKKRKGKRKINWKKETKKLG